MVSGQARPVRAKRSQPGTTSGIQVWQRRHLALQGRVSCRDLAVPVRGSDSAAAGWRFQPMIQAHGCKKQQSCATTLDRRGLLTPLHRKGDQPKDWRAPFQEYGFLRQVFPLFFFFNLAGVLKHASLVSFSVLAHTV